MEIGHVGTRNQKNEGDAAQQHAREAGDQVSGNVFTEELDAGGSLGVRLRKLFSDAGGERFDLRAGLG